MSEPDAAGQTSLSVASTDMLQPLLPDWQAPPQVRAACSTRPGGVSLGPWAGLNLGRSSGDDAEAVSENRRRLACALDLPSQPCWLQQVHGTGVVRWTEPGSDRSNAHPPAADAAFTTQPGVVCVVQAADCLPVLLTDEAGTMVGAVHAGWRGLAAGVIEQTVCAMCAACAGLPEGLPNRLLAWLGPAIGPQAFEVGGEVYAAFVGADPQAADAFRPARAGHYFADLFALARLALQRAGVTQISGGGVCTYADPHRFYSYRRDAITGRMAALIWLEPQSGAAVAA